MSAAFDAAFAKTFNLEKGLSNNKNDSGGVTIWGISEGVARAHGYTGEMSEMPVPVAKEIFRVSYWNAQRLDDISFLSRAIAEELFDSGVNMGVSTAGKFLQRALNVLNHEAKDYADLFIDGRIGIVTAHALEKYLGRRGKEGEAVMLKALNALQAMHYIEIAEGKSTQEDFVYGWLRTRVS